jgi:general secretion pathway protein L
MTTLTWSDSATPWLRYLRQAANWWLAELYGLVPQSLISTLHHQGRATAKLELHPDTASLLVQGPNRKTCDVIPIPLDDVAAITARADLAERTVEIILDEGFLFRPCVDLPLAAENALASILRHQLERLVPLDPATLRFVWTVKERLPEKNLLKVEICLVKQSTLERALLLSERLGLKPRRILVAGEGGLLVPVWRQQAAEPLQGRQRVLCRGLEFITVVFVCATYASVILRLGSERSALQSKVAALEERATSVSVLAARTAAAETMLAQVRNRVAAPTALAVLDELTKALPLDASVSEFHVQGRKVVIVGTASHATSLLGAIEQSPFFSNATFTAPITAGVAGIGERYQISFDVKETVGR